jgi:CubicO group peptidase (beta-lactamase class C family)
MDVTGKSFPELMQKMLLEKLGMTHSTFQQPLSRLWLLTLPPVICLMAKKW